MHYQLYIRAAKLSDWVKSNWLQTICENSIVYKALSWDLLHIRNYSHFETLFGNRHLIEIDIKNTQLYVPNDSKYFSFAV